MKKLHHGLWIAGGTAILLGGCYYTPGYSYIRGDGSAGDAYYGIAPDPSVSYYGGVGYYGSYDSPSWCCGYGYGYGYGYPYGGGYWGSWSGGYPAYVSPRWHGHGNHSPGGSWRPGHGSYRQPILTSPSGMRSGAPSTRITPATGTMRPAQPRSPRSGRP